MKYKLNKFLVKLSTKYKRPLASKLKVKSLRFSQDKIRKLNRQRGNVLQKIDINLTNKIFEY